MAEIVAVRSIDSDAASVWKVVGDFANFQNVSPAVDEVKMLSAVDRDEGAKRKCSFNSGDSVVHTICKWDEDAMSYEYEITQDYIPFQSLHFAFQVEPTEQSSLVTAKVIIAANRPIPEKARRTKLEPQFKPNLELLLAGIAYFVKTGNPTSKDDTLESMNAVIEAS